MNPKSVSALAPSLFRQRPYAMTLCHSHRRAGQIVTVMVFVLSSLTSGPVRSQVTDETSESDAPGQAADSLTDVLPSTILELTRGPIASATIGLPLGPQPNPDHRPFLLFLPEALMKVSGAPDSLRALRAQYEGGPQPLLVGILDYGTIPADLRAHYRSEISDGHAEKRTHSVGGHDLLVLRGNGSSDDVVVPHGVKALVGGQYEVVVFEQPPEGVTSIADFDALPKGKVDGMVSRAQEFLYALDLQTLVELAGPEQ